MNLLTIKQAAEMLSISSKHFRQQFVNTGQVNVIQLGKSSRGDRVENSEVEDLINKLRSKRCQSINAKKETAKKVKFGGLDSKSTDTGSLDPLGLPQSGRLKNLSVN